jgi:UDP-GlcNAc3NAcA epimerase
MILPSKKILTVLGARPQFIKAAAVSKAISKSRLLHEEIVHTGQHFDSNMSEIFFREMGIPEPVLNLGICGGTHSDLTARMLKAVDQEIIERKPDCILVYGDTTNTLAGALAGAKQKLPVAHVEAGLRSFNRAMPEELNRIITDHLSILLFCPSDVAKRNLVHEGIGNGEFNDTPGDPPFADSPEIVVTGDVMVDTIRIFGREALNRRGILKNHGICAGNFILSTIHRPENTDNPENLGSIACALGLIAAKNIPVILPLHPRTRQAVERFGIEFPAGVKIIEPQSYLDMLCLTGNAMCVITDSGGLQKEAFLMGRPCVTMRGQTEWTETVDLGWNIVAGAESSRIVKAFLEISANMTGKCGKLPEVYGDGYASERIVASLENRLFR